MGIGDKDRAVAESTVQLLAQHALSAAEQPWLFYRRPLGWGWGWQSWRQIADRVARARQDLLSLPVARAVAYDPVGIDGPSLELSLRAAGLLPIPVSAITPLPAFCQQRLLPVASDSRSGEAKDAGGLILPDIRTRLERWTPMALPTSPERTYTSQVIIPVAGGYGRVTENALFVAARTLDAELPSLPARPIVVAGDDLGSLAGRLLYTWGIQRDAAQVMLADPEDLVAAVLEVRPHLVQGRAVELALLAATIEASRRLRRGLRLRQVWVPPGEEEESGAELWARLGVRCMPLPLAGLSLLPWPRPEKDSEGEARAPEGGDSE